MAQSFVRQLGYEPGVQLNPLQDNTDGFANAPDDQVFAIPLRSLRGRIDKPFLVNRSTFTRSLGKGESIRTNRLNEGMAHVYSALNNGAYQCLAYRLHTDAAKNQYIVATVSGTSFDYTLSDDIPTAEFALAIKHLECFNDGVKVSIHADKVKNDSGVEIANDEITLRIYDASDDTLFEYTGSLNPEAKNDYGETNYLPDVIEDQTDLLIVEIGTLESIPTTSDAYGLDANGYEKEVISDVMMYFTEGGTGYSQEDYNKARVALGRAKDNYSYISAGGSQSVALLSELIGLAYDSNRQFRFDIDGDLTPDAAIEFSEQLGIPSNAEHLIHAFWKPIYNRDPLGVSPKYAMGASTLNIAFACGRNAMQDAKGFAKKNQPIAGKAYPLTFNSMVQSYYPTQQELSNLAKAKINPVLFEEYNGGGRYVFTDSLTMAKTTVSNRMNIAATDMSTSIDDSVTKFAKECLQLPMAESVQKMKDFLQSLFEGAESAKWLTPSDYMGGKSFDYSVTPNSVQPNSKMDVSYMLHYDGTARQIVVTQTYAKA